MKSIFEAYKKKPDVNSVSQEFWDMTKLVNWKKVVSAHNKAKLEGEWDNIRVTDAKKAAEKRLYTKYEYSQIYAFFKEWKYLYPLLSEYFKPVWLNKNYNFMPSDDGYWDLISSIVGFGKEFTKECIDDPNNFVKMAKDDFYVENFSYLLQISKDEYWEKMTEYDPFWRDVRQYNL
jgi:hypothetical protein